MMKQRNVRFAKNLVAILMVIASVFTLLPQGGLVAKAEEKSPVAAPSV